MYDQHLDNLATSKYEYKLYVNTMYSLRSETVCWRRLIATFLYSIFRKIINGDLFVTKKNVDISPLP